MCVESKMATPAVQVNCDDYLEFQDALKKMRSIDDKIVYALNTSIPTDSFKSQINATERCKSLYEQLTQSYEQRESAIKKCIAHVSKHVHELKEQQTTDSDNMDILKNLKKEQNKLRLMQGELNIEEVLKDRTLKVFYERCRTAYKPPDFQL